MKARVQRIGRGGFKELDDGNVTKLPHIKPKTVEGGRLRSGNPFPANFTSDYYKHSKEPLVGSGRAGGGVKLNGIGPETIPPRGVKIGAGFF